MKAVCVLFIYIYQKNAQAPTDLPKATDFVGKPEIAASPPVSVSAATRPLSLQSQIQLLKVRKGAVLSLQRTARWITMLLCRKSF